MRLYLNFFFVKKFFGVINVKDNEGLGGLVNGNFEDVVYVWVFVMFMEVLIDVYWVFCLVIIDYIVYFYDR